jgi:hypothetical protein
MTVSSRGGWHRLSDVTIGLVLGVSAALASVWIVEWFTLGISGAVESVFGWAGQEGALVPRFAPRFDECRLGIMESDWARCAVRA